MLRVTKITECLGISRSGTYAYIKAGLLPPLIKVGEKSSALPDYEVDLITSARIAGKSEAEIREIVTTLVEARAHAFTEVSGRAGIGTATELTGGGDHEY